LKSLQFGGFWWSLRIGVLVVDLWFLMIRWVVGHELLAKGCPWGTPAIPKVSLKFVSESGDRLRWSSSFSRGWSSSRVLRQNRPNRFRRPAWLVWSMLGFWGELWRASLFLVEVYLVQVLSSLKFVCLEFSIVDLLGVSV
jgi:hypothetical protein